MIMKTHKLPKTHKKVEAKVTKVIDGDTMEITDKDNKTYIVRLWGIDSPEMEQEFGIEAKNYIEKRILGKDSDFSLFAVGDYGRNIGQLFVEGTTGTPTDVAAVMVGAGYAHSTERSHDGPYYELEVRAKSMKKGLWIKDNFMHPKEFREQVHLIEKPDHIEAYPEEFESGKKKNKYKNTTKFLR